MALDDIVGGFIDPDGGVLVVSQLHDYSANNPRTMGQTYINPGGSVGASEVLQRQEQEFQLVDTGASDNGNGILVWDRYDASDAFTRHTWVSTRQPGQLLSAPAAFGSVTRSGSAPSAAIADDGSAAVFYSDGSSCVDGKAAGPAPWVATRAAGSSKWVTTSRGAAVRSQLAVPASGGSRIVALYYDSLNPCGTWPVPVSYKLGLSGQSQSLTAPQGVAVGASNDHITVASAVNASGVAAALVHATGDTAVSASTLITVNAPGASPKKLTTATPTISGTAAVGKKLTAVPGTWTRGAKLTYQWYASGTAIADATAASFTVTAAQLDKAMTVKVTGSLSGYATVSKTSAATAKAAKGTLTTATPKIAGTAKVGKKLTVTAGTWTGGTKLTYQWYASGTAIAKATAASFAVQPAQAGKTITVKVTGSKSGYTTASKTSKATAKVAKGTLKTATPKITGTAKVGKKLKAVTGTWTGGTKLTYQWYAAGTAIKKATKSTLTLTSKQAGKKITVKVTGKKSGHTTVTKTSKATAKVKK